MTFEEFKELALNPPRREEPTIFKVIQYSIIPPDEEDMPPHAKIDISKLCVGYERTLDEAEGLMRRAIEEGGESSAYIYCFHIREHPIGEDIEASYNDFGVSARLYNECGELLDCTYCSDLDRDWNTEFGRFRGRGSEQRRFREGEMVEFLTEDEIRIVEVGSSGPSIEWCWRIRECIRTEPRFQKKDGTPLTEDEIDERYRLDCSDDQIMVYYDDLEANENDPGGRGGDANRDHEHVSPLFLRHRTGLLDACFMNPHRNNNL